MQDEKQIISNIKLISFLIFICSMGILVCLGINKFFSTKSKEEIVEADENYSYGEIDESKTPISDNYPKSLDTKISNMIGTTPLNLIQSGEIVSNENFIIYLKYNKDINNYDTYLLNKEKNIILSPNDFPSLNQYVTAVDVLLGKNNLETGIAIATLYKGYGTEAINVDETIAKTEKLNKDNYKDFSKVETAIDGVVRGKNITQQDEVDAMVKAINDAIIALEKKDEIVKPKTNDAQVPNTRNHNLIIIYGTLISVSILCLSSLLKRR